MSANFFKPTRPNGWWLALGYSAWTLASIMLFSSIVILIFLLGVAPLIGISEEILRQPQWTLALYAAQYGIGLGILLLLPALFQKQNKQKLRELFGLIYRPKLKDIGTVAVVFILYFMASIVVQMVVGLLVPGFNADQAQDVGFDGISAPIELVVAFVALVILAPIAEELIFRGYLFGSLRDNISVLPAAIITSAIFGLVHGQWNVGLDTFVLSLALCYLREKTGSIWAGVLLHAIKNGLAYFLLFIAPLIGFNLIQ